MRNMQRMMALSCALLSWVVTIAAGGNGNTQYAKYLQECVCTNTCEHRRNGACNDGGAGSVDGTCALGTDCADCGPSLRSSLSTAKGALCPDQLLRLGQAAEEQCPAGKFHLDASGTDPYATGVAETPAQYRVAEMRVQAAAQGGARECLTCPLGRFASARGAKTCTRCPAGRFTRTAGATTCEACAAGRWQPWAARVRDAHSCRRCNAGRFSRAAAAAANACVRCPIGRLSAADGASCVGTCPPGTMITKNIWGLEAGCAECAAGRFQAEGGHAACAPCPPGSFSFTGQQGCVACSARCKRQAYPAGCGAGGKAGVCVDCAQGTYEEWVTRDVCKHCPAGKRQDRQQYYMCNAIHAPTPMPTPDPTPAPPTPPPAPGGNGDAVASAWFGAFHRHSAAPRAPYSDSGSSTVSNMAPGASSSLWHAAVGAALGTSHPEDSQHGHAEEQGHRSFAWMRAVSPKGYKYTSYASMVKQMDRAEEASAQAGGTLLRGGAAPTSHTQSEGMSWAEIWGKH